MSITFQSSALALISCLCAMSLVQSAPKSDGPMHRATGTFDVRVAPLEPYNKDDKSLGRFSIDKQFHGDIDGTGKGEMLSFGTGAAGSSGGYVAMEKVSGKLNGRSGSFALQLNSTMDAGKPSLSIIVVPGSGTGELAGITGKFDINDFTKHRYVIEYTLPEGP